MEAAEADAAAETARLLAALQTPADALDACDLCREDGARLVRLYLVKHSMFWNRV